MESDEKVKAAVSILDEQVESLKNIIEKASKDGDFDTASERKNRWKERTARLIEKNIHPNEAEKLKKKRKGSFIMGDPLRNLVDEGDMYIGFLKSLREALIEYPDDVIAVPTPTESDMPEIEAPSVSSSNDVFIIHGHDELNLLRLKELFRDRWDLRPIVLSSEPGKGRALIEKFEDEAQRATFTFALFTPDDFIQIEGKEYAQARPNVIFELGWFYGRLGRDRVCILFKEGTKVPSDLDGISRIQFSESVEEKIVEIERELIGSGVLKE